MRWITSLLFVAGICGFQCQGLTAEGVAPSSVAVAADKWPAVSIHPQNPKYFLFRGRPLVLVTATEHYGAVVNRAFDIERYLRDAADKHQTLTRTFLLFREQQSVRNPYSPIKPDSPDFMAPWPRTGPAAAIDGEPKYDLDQWNPEYFRRLHRFLQLASQLGIVVELTVFSHSYSDSVWGLNPLNAKNNLQKVGEGSWANYNSLKDPALVSRQIGYVKKIIEETAGYDNVYFEICNEAGAGIPGNATSADADEWQEEIGKVIRSELRRHGKTHMVVGTQAFSYTPSMHQELDESFSGSLFDAVNIHPCHPDSTLRGRVYSMGRFMSKDLRLAELADFCRATQVFPKPCISDEDNVATMYRDETGWTIHRKRAWTAVLNQVHYDFIDFSIVPGSESGTEVSNGKIRTWMKHLSDFIHSFDFISAKPSVDWITPELPHLMCSAMAKPGEDYIAYLADDRELTDATSGQPMDGRITLHLPDGDYRAFFFGPTSGEYSPGQNVVGGQTVQILLPRFRHDIVLRITRNR